jgi:undecaprenyl-diphosphatase
MGKFFLALCFPLLFAGRADCDDVFSRSEAALLGMVQGVTEFLPISSTAHLLLLDDALSKGGDGGDGSKNGQLAADMALRRHGKNSYFSVIQIGSIFAVLLLYRHRFASMARGVFSRDRRGRRLLKNLIVSISPALVMGSCVDGWLQGTLYGKIPIAAALMAGAVIMLAVERSHAAKLRKSAKTIDTISAMDSLSIGLWQCLSFVPGMSRSMATIVGGYRRGLRRSEAAEYSFLLGVVTLSAATMYKLVKDFDVIALCFSAVTFSLGIVVAFIASIAAIKVFVAFIGRHGMAPFALYRAILAVAIVYGVAVPR